jgi:eukaryotic-like serine/threonine-protein kinase
MSWNPMRFLESSSTPAVATEPPKASKSANGLPQTEGYELLEVVGQGGMATVYRGRNRRTGDTVAVKILRPELARKSELCQRFEQEFKAARLLRHPHILRSLDFGHCEAGPYLVLPFVTGESLGDRIARVGALPPAEAVRIVGEIARALDHAHQEGVIHRDVKPDNILITSEGKALLADFGLVKIAADELELTMPGQGMGTPNFTAPEQLANARGVDRRCDIYGLGATLYTALTGQYPFAGRTLLNIIKKKANNELILPRAIVPSLSEALEQVVLRAVHPEPGRRPATCGEFAWELNRATANLPKPSTPDSAVRRAPRAPKPETPLIVGNETLSPEASQPTGACRWLLAAVAAGVAAGVAMAFWR